VKLSKGRYEGKRLMLAEMRRMGRTDWRKRFPGPTFFTGKDKGELRVLLGSRLPQGEVRSELRGFHQSRFWLVDFGLGAAEVNYAAIPTDLLERIFVVV
jgi:hypothetical protein